MISKKEFEQFLRYPEKSGNSVLSVYLEMDPAWEKSSNHRAVAVFKSIVQNFQKNSLLQKDELFHKNINVAENFIRDFESSGPALVIFSDVSEGLLWAKELKVRIPSQIYWKQKPYLLPLLETFDEYERCAVVLADKGHARFFTFFLGEIEEEEGAIASNDVRTIRVTGRDNLGSQRQLERTNQMHTDWLLKRVVGKMEELARRYSFDRLILGGSKDVVTELETLLPPVLKSKLVGKVSLSVRAPEKEIRDVLNSFEKGVERKSEDKIVDELMTAARNPSLAILGLAAMKNMVKQHRIRKLVYAEGWDHETKLCLGCGSVYHERTDVCRLCQFALEPADDLLEQAACTVVKSGGEVEKVSSTAAERLKSNGGVGAFLWGR